MDEAISVDARLRRMAVDEARQNAQTVALLGDLDLDARLEIRLGAGKAAGPDVENDLGFNLRKDLGDELSEPSGRVGLGDGKVFEALAGDRRLA